MRLGVIIGRFQTPYLHEGHKHLINTAISENNRVMILVGTKADSDGDPNDDRNPYSFAERVEIIRKDFPDALIYKLTDVPESDEVWSRRVDEIVGTVMDMEGYYTAALYHSRDSFKDYYSGEIPTVEVEQISGISATQIREAMKKSREFGDLSLEEQQPYLDKAVELLNGLFYCTRVWEAWSVGTMTEDDFGLADESNDLIYEKAEILYNFNNK